MKHNGQSLAPLAISEVKQIAGRAGRYRTSHQAVTQDNKTSEAVVDPSIESPIVQPDTETVGYATTLDSYDYKYLKHCMEREAEPIATAGVFPPAIVVERFAQYFPPNTPFSYILQRLHEISKLHPRFRLCGLKDQLNIAEAILPIKNLNVQERLMICSAPFNVKEVEEQEFLRALVSCIAENKEANLLDVPMPLEVLDKKPSADRKYLFSLEQLHKMLVLYLWLSYRFPNTFTTRALANFTKKLVEDKIDSTLSQFSVTEQNRLKMIKQRAEAMKRFESSAENAEKAEDAMEGFATETEVDDVNEFPTPELEVDEADGSAEGDSAPNSTQPGKDAGFIPADQPGSTEARI
jgi:ATP-dependent RNA helicase SUPV3L1/SUV3